MNLGRSSRWNQGREYIRGEIFLCQVAKFVARILYEESQALFEAKQCVVILIKMLTFVQRVKRIYCVIVNKLIWKSKLFVTIGTLGEIDFNIFVYPYNSFYLHWLGNILVLYYSLWFICLSFMYNAIWCEFSFVFFRIWTVQICISLKKLKWTLYNILNKKKNKLFIFCKFYT